MTLPSWRIRPISEEQTFTDCVILAKESFDPEAVFLDDIVDDEVLPRLTLAVDGLTKSGERAGGKMEVSNDDAAGNQIIKPSSTMPEVLLASDHLDVYGWETSLWKKIRGYLGI